MVNYTCDAFNGHVEIMCTGPAENINDHEGQSRRHEIPDDDDVPDDKMPRNDWPPLFEISTRSKCSVEPILKCITIMSLRATSGPRVYITILQITSPNLDTAHWPTWRLYKTILVIGHCLSHKLISKTQTEMFLKVQIPFYC